MRKHILAITLSLFSCAIYVAGCVLKKSTQSSEQNYLGMYRSDRNIEGGYYKECLLLDSNFKVYYIMDTADYCKKENGAMRQDYGGISEFVIKGDSIKFQFDSLVHTKSKGSFYKGGELITVYSKTFGKKIHESYYGKYTKDTLHLTLKIIDRHFKDTTFQKINFIKCR